MAELELSLDDFRDYYESQKLGNLYLPNGSYKVRLRDLYENIVSWKINDKTLTIDDLTAIFAIGSAVHHPGYQVVSTSTKKYWFFGPIQKSIRKIHIRPNDVDFLILTRENMTEEKVIPSLREERASDGYGGGTTFVVVSNEMHLICRGLNQMLAGIDYRDGTRLPIDSVSEHTLREGVLLFYNEAEWKHFIARASVKKETPRRVIWDETLWGNNLVGHIK